VKFALVAMSFIVFDIEIIFLYPWATIYRELGPYGLFAIAAFTLPILVSLAYEFSKGALDWGPPRRGDVHRDEGIVSSERTATTTVRRVGLEGRPAASPNEAA
jgi:NADH-quinone oxidoreductase subunit A